MEPTAFKIELDLEVCCICNNGNDDDDLMTPEEHDAAAPPMSAPLRTMLLHLNNNKVIPDGRLCGSCVRRTTESYEFATAISARSAPPLSEKIKALRRKLHELTQKIDVFIVVGGPGVDTNSYSEDDIILVDKEALAAATAADDAEQEKARNARGDTVYQCTVCPLSFQRVAEFRTHVATHPGDSLHSCWTCGAQFADKASLQEHSIGHKDDDEIICYLCKSSFTRPSELRRHEVSCQSICPAAACRASFPSRQELARHCSAVHARPPQVLLCPHCFRESLTAGEQSAHLLKHRQCKQFVCGYDACILRFSSRNHLLAHIRKCHAGEEALETLEPDTTCSVCSRQFGSVAAMKRHAKVHQRAAVQEFLELDVEPAAAAEVDGEGVEYLEMDALDEADFDTKVQIQYV